MNKPKFIFKLFLFLSVLSVTNSFAQNETKTPPADQCYEVVLQILIASNNAAEKNVVPPTLSNVVKKLKTLYAFSDYRLTTTSLQRTSNSIKYKSLLSDFSQNPDNAAPVFSEWALMNLRNLPNSSGRNTLQFEYFKFDARIPVMTERVKDASEKTAPIVNYDSVGISTTRFSLSENEATVIGSLATSKPGELMFLVLTVKPVE